MILPIAFFFFQSWLTPLGGSGFTPTQTNPSGQACTVGISVNLTYTIPVPVTYWGCSGATGVNNGTYQQIGGAASGINTPSFTAIPKATASSPNLTAATSGDILTTLGNPAGVQPAVGSSCTVTGTFPNQYLNCPTTGGVIVPTFTGIPKATSSSGTLTQANLSDVLAAMGSPGGTTSSNTNCSFSGTFPNQIINCVGGATIPSVTNLIAGSGTGNGSDSGISASQVATLTGTQTLTGKTVDGVNPTVFGYLPNISSDVQTQLNGKAPLASPAFTGTPTAPTPSNGDNTTKVATTAWVLANTSGGSGTVASGTAGQIAHYAANGTTVSGETQIPNAAVPNPTTSALGGVEAIAAVSHQWINSISTSGVPALSQPAFSDISGSVAATQLPNPSATTLGGVESLAAVTHNFLTSISTAGAPTQAQPSFSDLTGSASLGQLPGSGTITINTVPCTLNGTCTVTGSSNATQIQSVAVSATAPTTGQTLTFNGSIYAPATPSGSIASVTNLIAGNGSGAGVDSSIAPKNVVPQFNAASYQTGGGNNGIQNAITACSTSTCSVVAPPTYATTEAIPCTYVNVGQIFTPAGCAYTVGGNVAYQDQRYPNFWMSADALGPYPATNYWPNFMWKSFTTKYQPAYASSGSPISQLTVGNSINLLALDGGLNFASGGTNLKDWQIALDLYDHVYTNGQSIGMRTSVNKYGVGDALGILGLVNCYGGFNAASDEGCEAIDVQASSGLQQFQGTIDSSTVSTSNQLVVDVTPIFTGQPYPDGTQGALRAALDTTAALTGTVTAINNSISATQPVVYTLSSSSLGTSTNTTVAIGFAFPSGTPSSPGSQTVTPASMGSITTGTKLCAWDIANKEQVVVTGTTGTTFSAVFRYPHLAGFNISYGGQACTWIELAPDKATNSHWSNAPFAPYNTLDLYYPVVSSTANTVTVWIQSPDVSYQYEQYNGQGIVGSAYSIVPGAEVTSVQKNQQLSDTLTLEIPINKVSGGNASITPFATGNNMIQPLYHNLNVYGGLYTAEQMFPTRTGTGAIWTFDHAVNMGGNNNAFQINNNNPPYLYTANGGTLSPPHMWSIGGQSPYQDFFNYGYHQGGGSAYQSPYALFGSEDTTNCTMIWTAYSTNTWLQACPGGKYTFGSYASPAKNISVDSIHGSIGINATAASSPFATDLVGQLTLSSGTATYSFTGTYSAAPICTATDTTAANPVKVSNAGSSPWTLTITGTGTDVINYICMARF